MAWLPELRQLAIPSVSILISFLAFSSQYLFHHIQPGPLSRNEAIIFNGLVACIWICYERACRVNPGDFRTMTGNQTANASVGKKMGEAELESLVSSGKVRWCRKCDAIKPPRAHHCRQCQRCIPKMDHHCPWTSNCVSHTTYPHFLRFVFYAVAAMALLEYHLYVRGALVFSQRNLPSYLGPSLLALVHLFLLIMVNSLTLFTLTILLLSSFHSLGLNTSMIESWEIERHEALVERSRRSGGFIHAPGGARVRIEQQEFPYDIGIWQNICQAMGYGNPIAWFIPFAGGPSMETASEWPVNGIEDERKTWPPIDPEKLPRGWRDGKTQLNNTAPVVGSSDDSFLGDGDDKARVDAFRRRQQQDYQRVENLRLRRGWKEAPDEESRSDDDGEESDVLEYEEGLDGELGWTNSDGDRLRDYGVDEDVDDDDVPLGELLRRRNTQPLVTRP